MFRILNLTGSHKSCCALLALCATFGANAIKISDENPASYLPDPDYRIVLAPEQYIATVNKQKGSTDQERFTMSESDHFISVDYFDETYTWPILKDYDGVTVTGHAIAYLGIDDINGRHAYPQIALGDGAAPASITFNFDPTFLSENDFTPISVVLTQCSSFAPESDVEFSVNNQKVSTGFRKWSEVEVNLNGRPLSALTIAVDAGKIIGFDEIWLYLTENNNSGIQSLPTDNDATPLKYYNLDGSEACNPDAAHGILIEVATDGSARKILKP